jgi:transcriptional regulator with XRE-family HTH domain
MTNIIGMLDLTSIGERTASERKLRKLSQIQVARIAGVSRQTMDLLENGRATEIGYSKLVRILAAVGLELRLEPLSSERPTLDDLLKEDAGDD